MADMSGSLRAALWAELWVVWKVALLVRKTADSRAVL